MYYSEESMLVTKGFLDSEILCFTVHREVPVTTLPVSSVLLCK